MKKRTLAEVLNDMDKIEQEQFLLEKKYGDEKYHLDKKYEEKSQSLKRDYENDLRSLRSFEKIERK